MKIAFESLMNTKKKKGRAKIEKIPNNQLPSKGAHKIAIRQQFIRNSQETLQKTILSRNAMKIHLGQSPEISNMNPRTKKKGISTTK